MRTVQLISPSGQREWGLLAVANFILGGAGTGLYIINYATILFDSPFSEQHKTAPYDFLSLSIVALGFLCVAAEAGRPFRGYYIFSRFGKSWISREVIAFTVFVLAVLLNHFFRHWVFNMIAAVSALCFMIIQGLIVYSSRAVKLWNTAFMPFIFMSSGLASGAGVSLLFALSDISMLGSILPVLSLLCVVFNLVIWFLYLRWYSVDSFYPVKEQPVLNRYSFKMVFTMVIGHIIAILLLMLLWQIRAHQGLGETLKGVLVAVSSLTIIIGVSAQKAWIVISAGCTRNIALKF